MFGFGKRQSSQPASEEEESASRKLQALQRGRAARGRTRRLKEADDVAEELARMKERETAGEAALANGAEFDNAIQDEKLDWLWWALVWLVILPPR